MSENLEILQDESLLDNERAKELSQWRVEQIISILGLEECANTPVGNHLVRGISGGQKKRVTVGQMLVSNARALLLDEVRLNAIFRILHRQPK